MDLFILIFAIVMVVVLYFALKKDSPDRYAEPTTPMRSIKSQCYGNSIELQVPENCDYLEFKIAGANYRGDLSTLVGSFEGTLVPEPENTYNKEAIMIKWNGQRHIGYVPDDMLWKVRMFTGQKFPAECSGVLAKSEDQDGNGFFWGLVVLTKEKEKTAE